MCLICADFVLVGDIDQPRLTVFWLQFRTRLCLKLAWTGDVNRNGENVARLIWATYLLRFGRRLEGIRRTCRVLRHRKVSGGYLPVYAALRYELL